MLDEYKKKRNFKVTPEPKDNNYSLDNKMIDSDKTDRLPKSAPRFVFQKHDATRLHYDFRLESQKNNVLISWAIPKGPSLDPSMKRLAIQTEDHPVDYLSFEGIIPEGNYGAGTVIVWDIGTYSLEETNMQPKRSKRQVEIDDVTDQLQKGRINFILEGRKLKGKFTLIKTKIENQWLLIKIKDRFSIETKDNEKKNRNDITKDKPESVLSGITNEELRNR